jgi:hypothetical protein
VVPPADADAMIGRLQAWYTAPPSMQGVRVHTLQDMLDRTLALYHALQGKSEAAGSQNENAGA